MLPTATPLFAGDFHDTALRLVQTQSSKKSANGGTAESWRHMLELGWQGVLVAETHGGAGADLTDLAGIVEALATQAVAVPLIDRCAVAPALLAASVARPAASAVLEAAATGRSSVAPVLHGPPPYATRHAPRVAQDGRLHAAELRADWTAPATHVLFDARRSEKDAPVLVLLDAAGLAARMRRYAGIDGSITAVIDVEGLTVSDEQALLEGAAAARAIDAAQQLGSVLGCVRTVAACAAMIEHTIEHLNTRVQFDVRLSTFQALRHRVVDMYVAFESARGLVREQVLQHARAPDARGLALTRLYVQGVGRTVGESAIQLHGGMGMSQETLAARLAMHALMSALQYGEKSDCLDWLVAGMAAEARAG